MDIPPDAVVRSDAGRCAPPITGHLLMSSTFDPSVVLLLFVIVEGRLCATSSVADNSTARLASQRAKRKVEFMFSPGI